MKTHKQICQNCQYYMTTTRYTWLCMKDCQLRREGMPINNPPKNCIMRLEHLLKGDKKMPKKSKWTKLKKELPPKPSSNPVLLYHPDPGGLKIDFKAVNRSFARTEAISEGYTHWMEIPKIK